MKKSSCKSFASSFSKINFFFEMHWFLVATHRDSLPVVSVGSSLQWILLSSTGSREHGLQ